MDEPDGTITARIESGTGYGVGAPESAAVTVRDNDDEDGVVPDPPTPVISIVADVSPIVEGSDAVFIITAGPTPSDDLNIIVDVSGGAGFTAVSGSQRVRLAAGTDTARLVVPTIDDTVDEPDGTITARIESGTGYGVGAPESAAVTVRDNDGEDGVVPDPPTSVISIVADVSPIVEGSDAVFIITASPTPSDDLNIIVDVSGGAGFTAVSGSQRVQFAPGTDTARLVVPTIDDTVDEPDGTITARIGSGTGYGVGTPESAAVTVRDNDSSGGGGGTRRRPVISIVADVSPIVEGSDAVFIITASPTPSDDLNIIVDVSGGAGFTAVSGSQRVRLAPGTDTARLVVPTIDDTVDEPDGTITARIGSGTGYGVGTPESAAVTVRDNDSSGGGGGTRRHPVISIVADVSPIVEGSDAVFIITASPTPSDDLNIIVDVSGGAGFTAVSGSQRVRLAAGTDTARLVVPTIDDTVDELDDEITATIQDRGGYRVSASGNMASVTVTDNDEPTVPSVSITAAAVSVVEGENVRFVIRASSTVGTDIAVTVHVSGGSAFGVEDGDRQVTITSNATSAELSLSTIDDTVDEPDGTITARIESGTGYGVGAPESASVTVRDNDSPTSGGGGSDSGSSRGRGTRLTPEVSIAADASPIVEGSDAVFIITASPTPSDDLNIMVDVSGGSDFTAVSGSQRVRLAAGTDTARLVVPTIDDTVDELDDEITATIQDRGGYRVSASDVSALVTVIDNDEVPGAPTDLTAVPGDGVVKLSWVAPEDHGSSGITHYTAEFSTESAFSTSAMKSNTDSAMTILTIDGLTSGRKHYFRVRAVSAVGPGDWSAPATSMPYLTTITTMTKPTPTRTRTPVPTATLVPIAAFAPTPTPMSTAVATPVPVATVDKPAPAANPTTVATKPVPSDPTLQTPARESGLIPKWWQIIVAAISLAIGLFMARRLWLRWRRQRDV